METNEQPDKKVQEIKAPIGTDERLDRFLTHQKLDVEVSRSAIQKLIKDGKVIVSGKVASKVGYKV